MTPRIDISIPVQSITTTTSKLTDEIKGDEWFNAAKFPTATFVSTNISPTEDGSFNVTGNLTLYGVTKASVLAAHFVNSGVNPITKAYTVGFEASTVVKRGDFGISKYLPMLGDDVRLKIAGAFEMQSQCAWHKHSSRLAGSVRCPVRFKPRVQESLMPGDLAFPETIPKLFPGRDRIRLVDDHLGYEWPP